MKIIIKGMASKSIILEEFVKEEKMKSVSVFHFLEEKKIPIASSCIGRGLCKKCIINKNILSCQITLKEMNLISKIIEIDYL